MNKNILLISISFLVSTWSFSQSITIVPNDINSSLNSTKVGANIVKIEGKLLTDNLNLNYKHGSASLRLIGNPNNSDFLSFANSNNTIDFLHGNVSRWSIGDYFNADFSGGSNNFRIRDYGNPQTFIPFEIEKGTNTVSLGNLIIKGMASYTNDGRSLKISTEGKIIASPNQFLNLGALDLVVLGSGTLSKDLGGSFGPTATSQAIYAPIHIPEDSEFVRFTVTYLDNSPLSSLMVSLISLNGNTPNAIASTTSSNITSSSNGTMTPSVYSGSLVVDNQNRQYYFEIKPRNQANTASGNWDTTLLKLVKIVLEYQ
ncbi:MAG: hypothetical protein K9I84_08575 [Leadbetterella sp.]|nr:hypothetical protein [Leadbetterella sp.]